MSRLGQEEELEVLLEPEPSRYFSAAEPYGGCKKIAIPLGVWPDGRLLGGVGKREEINVTGRRSCP